jgi:hypothetical protein
MFQNLLKALMQAKLQGFYIATTARPPFIRAALRGRAQVGHGIPSLRERTP